MEIIDENNNNFNDGDMVLITSKINVFDSRAEEEESLPANQNYVDNNFWNNTLDIESSSFEDLIKDL